MNGKETQNASKDPTRLEREAPASGEKEAKTGASTKEPAPVGNETAKSADETAKSADETAKGAEKTAKGADETAKSAEKTAKGAAAKEKLKSAVKESKEKLAQLKKMRKGRASEIFAVFAKHNFYAAGLTPRELRTTLEDLGPTYVKIGQIMSGRNDLLPAAYCKELAHLRSSVKPLDPAEARAVIEEETGKKIEELYKEFRDEPLGSASIAQAHYGVLLDGTRVVTKVQRPYIAEMMRQDFVLLHRLAKLVTIASEGEDGTVMIDLGSVIREFEKVTEEELDFRVEAANTNLFREACIEDDRVLSCPKIIERLTTEKILTMTYVDGYSIAKREQVEKDGYDRLAIGQTILENYMHQVLDAGVFHADPHEGNIMISRGVPYFIDFGMIGRISEGNVAIMQDVVAALVQNDVEAMTDAALSLGVINGKIDRARLVDEADAMVKKYLGVKDVSKIDVGALMLDFTGLLAEHRITVPGEFTMLARSLVTIEGVLAAFCPELNLFDAMSKAMFRRMLESIDLKEKAKSMLKNAALTGVRAVRLPGMAFDALKNLVKGKMKVGIELSGYDEAYRKLVTLIKNVTLAAFSCVLFAGSCILCTTDIAPQVQGIPLGALIGFILSVALAIYSVISMTKKQ